MAQYVTVTASLPQELLTLNAIPNPLTLTPPTWALGDLAWDSAPVCLKLVASVAPTVATGTWLTLTADVTTTILPDPAPENNTATVALPTTLDDSLTLILTAPERMLQRYGATPVQATLYTLAQHPQVRGVVVDVLQAPDIRTAYVAWDAEPLNVARAQAVAEAIKAMIDDYTITYPHLRYIVIVGSDDVIPFYRIRDRNPTMWQESAYAAYVPSLTPLWAALQGNYFLTDDFYAARNSTIPSSSLWTPGVPFFIPDFSLGRLVETPDEIQAAITAFLEQNGIALLGPALIGADPTPGLVEDGAQEVCETLTHDDLIITCTTHPITFKTQALALDAGSIWAAWHSNHSSLGVLTATEIQARTVDFGQTTIASIGCHSGLNVLAGAGMSPALDLPQVIGGRGGIYLAPTAYAYASRIGIAYSEVLFVELSQALALTNTQEIGPALVRAKQTYYTTYQNWFDHLDEKVLLGMTFYGFPMARVTSPEDEPVNPLSRRISTQADKVMLLDDSAVLTYSFSGLTYTLHTTLNGDYLDYQGHILVQDGLLVQPAFTQPLSPSIQGRTPRGVWLSDATYTITENFHPVIVQSWAIGAPHKPLQARASLTHQGWDRPLPYALSQFVGLYDTQAALNLVLGAYNAATQVEQVFTRLTLVVRYSDSADVTPPVITQSAGYSSNNITFHTVVTDESSVKAVAVVCDDGQGQWTAIPLHSSNGIAWQGSTLGPCVRFYLQAVDVHSNVVIGAWQPILEVAELRAYLPLVLRQP